MIAEDYSLYFSLIELTCGLLIVGTTLSRTSYLHKLYKGKKYFILGGLTLIFKEVLFLLNMYNGFPKEFINVVVYVLIALGISNFQKSKKRTIRT